MAVKQELRIGIGIAIGFVIVGGPLCAILGLAGCSANSHPSSGASKDLEVNRAKAIGVALLMYASDSDDHWPLVAGRELMRPYFKMPNEFDGFVYKRPQFATKGETPPSTELGYVKDEFGVLVVQADGSVHWRSDSPEK